MLVMRSGFQKKITEKDIDYVVDLYHEEISYTEYSIGKLIAYLKKMEIDRNTLIILTVDHCEPFFGT